MFNIPTEKLPACLKDEQRINVLFAPLRNRSVNPKDWDSKISSWKEIIKTYCETNNIYCFTFSSLSTTFVRNGRPPSCLNEVINDLLREGEVQFLDVFMKKNFDTWRRWAADVLIKRPLVWSFDKIKNTIFTIPNADQTYVHLEVVKTNCDKLMNSIPVKYKNKVISLRELLTILEKDSSHIISVKLLLHYLANERRIATMQLNSDKLKEEQEAFLIKFGDGSQVTPISDPDIGIYTLEQNEQVLSKDIEDLEDEIHNCVKEAKMHLAKSHRQMAKHSLRKKHELEKRVDKKANILHNIQVLLEKIQETHSDAHVWEAYKNALSAFNTSFKDAGMSEDAIENTMSNLGDMLEEHEEIQSALARPALEVDDSELEEELSALLRDANDQPGNDSGINTSNIEKDMGKMALDTPSVPDESPDVSLREAISQV